MLQDLFNRERVVPVRIERGKATKQATIGVAARLKRLRAHRENLAQLLTRTKRFHELDSCDPAVPVLVQLGVDAHHRGLEVSISGPALGLWRPRICGHSTHL